MVETDDVRGRERGEDFREGAYAFPLVEGENPSAPVFGRPSHRVNARCGPVPNASAARKGFAGEFRSGKSGKNLW